jgi:hypothetical protein
MEDKTMFEKTKEKVNNYFEEHPKVKKGLIVTAKVSAVAGAIFIGYKIGKSQNDISKLNFQPLPEVPENPVSPELVETFKEKITNPLAPDDHTFDVIFQDTETGTKYISKHYCLGSYVNDCLDGMDMPYEVLEDLKEGAETVVETVSAE